MSNCTYTGKAGYTSRAEAQESANRANARRFAKGGNITPKKCDHCGEWHLFHPQKPVHKTGYKRPRNLLREYA